MFRAETWLTLCCEILWAVICTEILGRECIYQLTSSLLKNRDRHVPPNCHCLTAHSVTHCHIFPPRPQSLQTLFHSNCADFKSILGLFFFFFPHDVSLLKHLSFPKCLASPSVKLMRISPFASVGTGSGLGRWNKAACGC